MSSNLHRNSTEANKHTPKGFDLADNNTTLLRDERGQSRYIDNLVNERVENLVDGFNAPPTTTSGHLYVLIDNGSGTVNTDWQGANYDDIVRIQDGVWVAITPVNGYLVFNKTDEKYYKFGSTGWVEFIPESSNIYTDNGTVGAGRVVTLTDTLSFSGGRVSFDTTTNGILLPRLTTLQMNGIATPSTNELVFNTDLNGIYRYNGSSWVALSSGYGIIGVYSGSGNGTPTFFATLQSALETCKASGGYFTVKLYSNLTITSSINIDYAGSGVGGAYLFRQLTIDFNGFSVTNAQADTSNAFTISLSNNVAVYQEIRFINGTVLRTNGTSTHHALKCDTINRYGTIQMSKMYWYCQNNHAARIGLRLSTDASAGKVCDLGGSVFVSNGTQRTLGLVNSEQTVTNFSCISTSSLAALYLEGGVAQNFYAENTSTGQAILQIGGIANNFISKSNGGISLDISGAEAHNFVARSTGTNATAVFVKSSGLITNFKCDAVDSHALQVDSSGVAINGFCQNNSNTRATIQTAGHNRMDNIEGINLGASFGGRIQGGNLTKCKFISVGGIGAQLYSWGPYPPAGLTAEGCTFESRLNTSGGHSCQVVPISAGVFLLTNCYFLVTNSGANAINATSAVTVRSRYCTHNEVATTPINANVTIVSSGIIS